MKTKKKKRQSFSAIEAKGKRLEALINLSRTVHDQDRQLPVPFNDFLYMATNDPKLVFRDIFQLFYDMVHYYIPEGIEEYPDMDDNIGFRDYDSTRLFIEDCDDPFLADRLFINRLMRLFDSFKQGTLKNHIFLFEGPPGSGKSTFLNNIINKLEDYTRLKAGSFFKTYWRLDVERLGGFKVLERKLQDMPSNSDSNEPATRTPIQIVNYPEKYLQFSCPRHDHPILQIPKSYRENFLDELISDEAFKDKLFNSREYEWVLKEIPCNICKSIYETLLNILEDPLEVFSMLSARRVRFNRQFGEGVSVFNPGDMIYHKPIANRTLENMINNIMRTDNVEFVYSTLAKTNNGVYALMDIKENNIQRLKNLHGIISDGVHKVELIEEHIKSLFLGLVNPEDKIHYAKVKSFQDRIININIPYIMDYNTEVSIYKNKFGDDIADHFLPRVLVNFAKIIISSRLDTNSVEIRKWLVNPEKYKKYLDQNLLLLKMDIYTGRIPSFLSEEDIKRFDKNTRKSVIGAAETEGFRGISGRQSLNIFNEFYKKYYRKDRPITMDDVQKYFTSDEPKLLAEVPSLFIDSLVDLYDWNVLQELKESIYYYNEEQIRDDILNYLYAINFEIGTTERSEYTGDEIDIDEEYFKNFEAMILGTTSSELQRKQFRSDEHKTYISQTLSREIRLDGKDITETEQYKKLFERYTRNLKENALAPYISNTNFRRAIVDYGTKQFNTYDNRLKRDIEYMIKHLMDDFGYTESGACQVALYVIDKDLPRKFMKS